MSELPVYFFDLADIRVQTLPKRDISQTFQENVMQKNIDAPDISVYRIRSNIVREFVSGIAYSCTKYYLKV